jgi:hypothetical protein
MSGAVEQIDGRPEQVIEVGLEAGFLQGDNKRAPSPGAKVRQYYYVSPAPTLTIRPGFPVRVIVTRDLVLEPYGG